MPNLESDLTNNIYPTNRMRSVLSSMYGAMVEKISQFTNLGGIYCMIPARTYKV